MLEALPPRKKGREEGVAAGDGMASFQICAQQPSRVMKEWQTGDASIWPESGRCTISWTPRMVETEAIFEQKVLLATVLGNQPALSPRDLVAVIVDCGILPAHFRVEVTIPEDYLIVFRSAREKDWILGKSKQVFFQGAPIAFKSWNRRLLASSTRFQFFTKLSLEGLPQHAWDEEAMAQLIRELGGELVELVPPADARVLTMFAWLKNPSAVPTTLEVEIPERAGGGPPCWERMAGSIRIPRAPLHKRTLTYSVIVHIEEIIDPTPLHVPLSMASNDEDDDDVPRRVTFSCWAGRIDGTGPWTSKQGGGRPFGGASGFAGGLPGRTWSTSSVQRVSEMIPTNPGALRDTARDDEHTEHVGSGLHASDRDTIEEHSSGEPGNRMAGRGDDAVCNVVPRVLATSTALVAGRDVLATGKDVLATENGVLATGKDVLATGGEVALVARSDA